MRRRKPLLRAALGALVVGALVAGALVRATTRHQPGPPPKVSEPTVGRGSAGGGPTSPPPHSLSTGATRPGTASTTTPGAAGTSAPGTSGPGSRPTTPVSQGPPIGVGSKPVIAGFIDRKGAPDPTWRGVVSAYVVNTTWADLQSSPAPLLAANNAIDSAIADVRRLNQARPTAPLVLKLRVLAGASAPAWAKQLDGPPLTVQDDTSSVTGTIGRFWTDRYGTAYAQLQRLLAARYDAIAEIVEVTMARCTTFFDEPFIRHASNPATAASLVRAGYTAAADARCLAEEIDAHAVWQRTESGLAFNPWQRVNPDASVTVDEAFTESMMTYCRAKLGHRCVLENDSIRWAPLTGPYDTMYQAMQRLGAPITFQTATPERIGDPIRTVQWAMAHGANAVELNRDYQTYPMVQIVAARDRLVANVR